MNQKQEDFGLHIAKIRYQMKLSQKELAEKAGVTRNSLSNYELGVCKPSFEALCRLKEALNVSWDVLMGSKEYRDEELYKKIQNLSEEHKKHLYGIIAVFEKR